MNYIYPALFSVEVVKGRGPVYTVEIPDIAGCVTEGESIPEAVSMAKEALGGCILAFKQAKEEIPAPSAYHDLTPSDNEFVTLIDVDLYEC